MSNNRAKVADNHETKRIIIRTHLVGERLAGMGGSGIVAVIVSEKIGNIEADAARADHSHTLTHLRRACWMDGCQENDRI